MTIQESLNIFMKEVETLLNENVQKDVLKMEIERIIKEAVPTIQKLLKKYKNCKIGKSGGIERRFDTKYKDEGYVALIQISSCKYKEAMDQVETYLIKYFRNYLENDTDLEVGNKTYSGDYWIYLVHKGKIISDDQAKPSK